MDDVRVITFPETEDVFASNRIVTSRYTWYNFLFINLFEQFHRATNIFFLFMAIGQAIPQISPLNQAAGFTQLIFMLVITGVKQAYEDYRKHRSDDEINNKTCKVIKCGTVTEILWQNLKVGDLVLITEGDTFPADCAILESKVTPCRVETAALDGETNHKSKHPITQPNLKNKQFSMEITPPIASLSTFSGRIVSESGSCSVGLESFVPRGCVLKGGEEALAIVCYTGDETKLMLNSMKPRFKFTELDRIMFKFSLVLIIAMLVICAIMAAGHYIWTERNRPAYLHLGSQGSSLLSFFSWIIDLQMILPLAVYSSLDVTRFLISFTVSRDPEMQEGETHAKCRDSNMVSTIGRVTHVFSDKTGTLTKNLMTFRAFALEKRVIGLDEPKEDRSSKGVHVSISQKSVDWVKSHLDDVEIQKLMLSICLSTPADVEGSYSVQEVIENPELLSYQVSSPDELALLHFARECGVILYANNVHRSELIINGVHQVFEKVVVFEFDSQRKRSSVIAKINNEYVLLIKGADDVIAGRSAHFPSSIRENVNALGSYGLRTLCFGYKILDDAESLITRHKNILESLADVNEQLNKLADELERDIITIGVTGVEDELQDHVRETLDQLRRAGIKIWMLTGDRTDAALNIAETSGLINQNMKIIKSSDDDYGVCDGAVMIVDEMNDRFMSAAMSCAAVICPRCEPSSKGNFIRKFKEVAPESVILAVGDGANDVDMIRISDVGVGVEGRDGRDAVLSSDFSIPSFRCLSRLLIVHGRFYAIRTWLLVIITFYKNLLLGLPQLLYGIFNGFSATTAFDSGYFALYNVVLTIPQHFYACVFEQDIDPETAMKHPEVYRETQNNGGFDPFEIAWFYIMAFVHAAIIFFFAYFGCSDCLLNGEGLTLDHAVFTQIIGWNVIVVFTYEMFVMFRSISIPQLVLNMVCLCSNFIIQYIYGYLDKEYFNVLPISIAAKRIWLELPLVLMCCVVMDLVKHAICRLVRPRVADLVVYGEIQKAHRAHPFWKVWGSPDCW